MGSSYSFLVSYKRAVKCSYQLHPLILARHWNAMPPVNRTEREKNRISDRSLAFNASLRSEDADHCAGSLSHALFLFLHGAPKMLPSGFLCFSTYGSVRRILKSYPNRNLVFPYCFLSRPEGALHFPYRLFHSISSVPAPNHSLLRHLIPLHLVGNDQPPAVLLRYSFIHRKDIFLPSLLTSLETAPATFPKTPLVLLAEGFQLILEGGHPQRHLREAFEKAELACRRILMDSELTNSSHFSLLLPSLSENCTSSTSHDYRSIIQYHEAAEREAWELVKISPLYRLWMFELQAAAAYYIEIFSIPSSSAHITCYDVAAMAVQHIVAGDVRRDALLANAVLHWEEFQVRKKCTEEVKVKENEVRGGKNRLFKDLYHRWMHSFQYWRWKNHLFKNDDKNNCSIRIASPQYFSLLHYMKCGKIFSPFPSEKVKSSSTTSVLVISRLSPILRCTSCLTYSLRPSKNVNSSDSTQISNHHTVEEKIISAPEDKCSCSNGLQFSPIYQFARDTSIPYTTLGDGCPSSIGRSDVKSKGEGVDANTAHSKDNTSIGMYSYTEEDAVVRELLLLERDCFGTYRFDLRGEHRHLFHVLHLEEVGKTWDSASVLFHPVVREFGGFCLLCTPIANGRWVRLQLSCESEEEDHRLWKDNSAGEKNIPARTYCEKCNTYTEHAQEKVIFTDADAIRRKRNDTLTSLTAPMPLFEEIRTCEEEAGTTASRSKRKPIIFTAYYNKPICPIRTTASRQERKQNQLHTEIFDLAIQQHHIE